VNSDGSRWRIGRGHSGAVLVEQQESFTSRPEHPRPNGRAKRNDFIRGSQSLCSSALPRPKNVLIQLLNLRNTRPESRRNQHYFLHVSFAGDISRLSRASLPTDIRIDAPPNRHQLSSRYARQLLAACGSGRCARG